MNTLDTIKKGEEEFVEKGAGLEHERWSKWQKYMHSQMIIADFPNGERFAQLPFEFFERWQRQIATNYSDLTEKEKESDREQVRPYLPLLKQNLIAILTSLAEEEREMDINEIDRQDQCGYNYAKQETIDRLEVIIKELV